MGTSRPASLAARPSRRPAPTECVRSSMTATGSRSGERATRCARSRDVPTIGAAGIRRSLWPRCSSARTSFTLDGEAVVCGRTGSRSSTPSTGAAPSAMPCCTSSRARAAARLSRALFVARTRSSDPTGPMDLVNTGHNGVRFLQTRVRPAHGQQQMWYGRCRRPAELEGAGQKSVTQGSTRAPD
jgi:hypothetical protein